MFDSVVSAESFLCVRLYITFLAGEKEAYLCHNNRCKVEVYLRILIFLFNQSIHICRDEVLDFQGGFSMKF